MSEWLVERVENPQPRDPRQSDGAHRAFFGDAERPFRLTAPLILELERKLDAGIGGIAQRLFAGNFRHAEIIETIRLALIGAGEKPARAAELVEAYAVNRPLAETYPLAVAILETAWFGAAQQPSEEAK
jgi:hypothetical protein